MMAFSQDARVLVVARTLTRRASEGRGTSNSFPRLRFAPSVWFAVMNAVAQSPNLALTPPESRERQPVSF